MPPLSPPAECAGHLEIRDDDTEPVIRRRLEVMSCFSVLPNGACLVSNLCPPQPAVPRPPPQIYQQQAKPVEEFFRDAGLLADFEITGGIPETLSSLLATLQRFVPKTLANSLA